MQEFLKQILDYNPKTGHLIWKKQVSNRALIGTIAGTINDKGYRIIKFTFQGKQYRIRAHRIAWFLMTGAWPKNQIDHRNGIKDANYWSNLREATNTINSKNSKKYSNNTSGNTGICFIPGKKKWKARLCGQHLGYFKSQAEAINARKQAETLDGDFSPRHGT